MDLREWVIGRGGIVARRAAADAGYSVDAVRRAARDGGVEIVRRHWIVAGTPPETLIAAARAGARVACVSAARVRGWWMPAGIPSVLHLHRVPGSAATGLPPEFSGRVHWTKPIAPTGRDSLLESVEDSLAHIALCVGREDALVIWEAAARAERLDPAALRRVAWPGPAARELAEDLGGLSDSGLETYVTTRIRGMGLRVRQQVVIAGRPVDHLIGDRLVVQVDGWEYHSSSAQRSADIAHDAELRLRGYTVFRFSYAQIVHDWAGVERTIARAVAAGLHL